MVTKAKDNALASIAELAKGLAEAAEDREKTSGTLKEILNLIGGLDKDDAKALFRDERVQALIEAATDQQAQSSDDPPGTIYSGLIGGQMVKSMTKKPWQENDLRSAVERGEVEMVYYEPRSTVPVVWNGLKRYFVADQEMYVEKIFVDVYKESLAATRAASEHAAWLFKKLQALSPQNRSMVTPGGARARGTADQGWYVPGGGNVGGRSEDEGTGEQT